MWANVVLPALGWQCFAALANPTAACRRAVGGAGTGRRPDGEASEREGAIRDRGAGEQRASARCLFRRHRPARPYDVHARRAESRSQGRFASQPNFSPLGRRPDARNRRNATTDDQGSSPCDLRAFAASRGCVPAGQSAQYEFPQGRRLVHPSRGSLSTRARIPVSLPAGCASTSRLHGCRSCRGEAGGALAGGSPLAAAATVVSGRFPAFSSPCSSCSCWCVPHATAGAVALAYAPWQRERRRPHPPGPPFPLPPPGPVLSPLEQALVLLENAVSGRWSAAEQRRGPRARRGGTGSARTGGIPSFARAARALAWSEDVRRCRKPRSSLLASGSVLDETYETHRNRGQHDGSPGLPARGLSAHVRCRLARTRKRFPSHPRMRTAQSLRLGLAATASERLILAGVGEPGSRKTGERGTAIAPGETRRDRHPILSLSDRGETIQRRSGAAHSGAHRREPANIGLVVFSYTRQVRTSCLPPGTTPRRSCGRCCFRLLVAPRLGLTLSIPGRRRFRAGTQISTRDQSSQETMPRAATRSVNRVPSSFSQRHTRPAATMMCGHLRRSISKPAATTESDLRSVPLGPSTAARVLFGDAIVGRRFREASDVRLGRRRPAARLSETDGHLPGHAS
jgi:hypothetical protein